MEKKLNAKISLWTTEFKKAVATQVQNISDLPKEKAALLLQFIYDYPHLELHKEDLQKRTRIKNTVPYHERCRAIRANGEQCTRRRKIDNQFCGTHIKGVPHGEITDQSKKETNVKTITVWAQEISGIIRHLDKNGNVYDPQDIYQNLKNPKIIGRYKQIGDSFLIC